jgi:hypothetical protein
MVRTVTQVDFSRSPALKRPVSVMREDQPLPLSLGPMSLVSRVNRKLAPQGKCVATTLKKKRLAGEKEFRLQECITGATRYLSLSELETMARELGVLATQY